jgi:hypothetical protein
VLHILVGYTARPDVLQLSAYIATLVLIVALMKFFEMQHRKSLA